MPTLHDSGNADPSATIYQQKQVMNLKFLTPFINRNKTLSIEYNKLRTDLKVLSNLTDKPLERQLPDQKFSTLLVLTDFTVP